MTRILLILLRNRTRSTVIVILGLWQSPTNDDDTATRLHHISVHTLDRYK